MKVTTKELYMSHKTGDTIDTCFTSKEECDEEVDELNDKFEKFFFVKHYPRFTNKRPYRRETLEEALRLEKEYSYEKALKEEREEYGF